MTNPIKYIREHAPVNSNALAIPLYYLAIGSVGFAVVWFTIDLVKAILHRVF